LSVSPERLQKVLASAGVASRRDCEELIAAGRVSVNGKVVVVPGTRVDPAEDEIVVDGQPIGVISPRTYVMLHKPTGVVSTTDDPQGRSTVVDLVSVDARLFPVGRLDYDSEGLLLLTDDGELTQQLTHPSHQIEKEYRVLLDQAPSPDALRQWREGVELDGVPTAPAWVDVAERAPDGVWVRVVLQEGRKRQIREVAKLLGYEVLRLIRVREGPLSLGDLPVGEWRALTDAEVEQLRAHAEQAQKEQTAAERPRQRGRREEDARADSAPARDAFRRGAAAGAAGGAAGAAARRSQDDRGPRDDRGGFNNRGSRDDRGPRDDRGGFNRGPRDDRSGPRDDRGSFNRGPRDDRGGFGDRGSFNRGPRDDRSGPRDDRGGFSNRGPRDDRSGPRDDRGGFSNRGPRDDRGSFNRGPRDDRGGYGDRGPRDERGGYSDRGDRGEREASSSRGAFNERDDARGRSNNNSERSGTEPPAEQGQAETRRPRPFFGRPGGIRRSAFGPRSRPEQDREGDE
jgi:23S rRNA pseudouridine2605 synthase